MLQTESTANSKTDPTRVLVLVDTQNMVHPDLRVDYSRLLEFCRQLGQVLKAAAFVTDGPDNLNFQLMLAQTGYEVHPVRPIVNGSGKTKCNADLLMAFWLGRAIEMYHLQAGDHVVLCTGDGDFTRIVEWLLSRDIQVTVVGYKISTSPYLRVLARFRALEDEPGLLRQQQGAAA